MPRRSRERRGIACRFSYVSKHNHAKPLIGIFTRTYASIRPQRSSISSI